MEDVTVFGKATNDIIKDDEGLNNLHFSINGKGTVVEASTVRCTSIRYRKVYLHLNNTDPEVQGLTPRAALRRLSRSP